MLAIFAGDARSAPAPQARPGVSAPR